MLVSRIVIIVLWILSLIGISFFGGPVSYGIFAAITAVPVVSIIYLLIIIVRFKIYQKVESKNVTANDVTDFYITLQNEDFFTYSSVRILFFPTFSSIEGIDDSTVYELMPRSGIKKETSLICKYRGVYEVGVKSVIIEDYFRIFKFTYKNREPFRVNVLTQIVHLDSIKSFDYSFVNEIDSINNPIETDVLVRDYIEGDELKKINWKLSAKNGKLLTRKDAGEMKRGISIVMDSARYYEKPEEYLPIENKIMETAIALSLYFSSCNSVVNFHAYEGKHEEFVISNSYEFSAFYDYTSTFKFQKNNTKENLFSSVINEKSIYESNTVILILHEVSDYDRSIIKHLESNNIFVFTYLINDGNEKELIDKSVINNMAVITSDSNLKEVL